jgi:hypothetical protein
VGPGCGMKGDAGSKTSAERLASAACVN